MPVSALLTRSALAGTLVLSSAVGLVTLGTPAYAATVTVTDLAGLQDALGPSCADGNVVELGADVAAPTATLEAACADLTLTLAGASALTLKNVVVDAGTGLTVTGESTDLLTVDASADENLAGIQNTGATLVLRDLGAVITGGRLGAGIGGAIQGVAGTTVIGGTATVEIEAGANAQGAAIGGGYLADGGETTVQDDAQVTVTSRTNAGGAALGGGYAGDGGTLVVRDQATVNATVRSGANGAAIGGGFQGDGGTVVVQDDAHVVAAARSGAKGAAIGGGYQGDGGTVTVSGAATVVATSTVSGDIVGATIGGGPGGDGADVTIDGGTVTAAASDQGSPLGAGSAVAGETLAFGTLRVNAGTLRLPSGGLRVLDRSDVTEVVVADGARVTGQNQTSARISGAGEIVNDGSIVLTPDVVRCSHLTGHHYRVVFDTRGTRHAPASKAPAPTRVFAASFDDGGRAFPANPVRPGFRFTGWNTRANGQGVAVTATSVLPGASATGEPQPVVAFATWERR